MNVYEKLAAVQDALNVPKSLYNKFSGFYYRSTEDILKAAKPLCIKNGLLLLVTDDVNMIGDRFYITATAKVVDIAEPLSVIAVTASAREATSKAKFDEAQLTGSSSSYARKYALSGLFALNDTEDADAHDNTQPQAPALLCSQCSQPIKDSAKATAQQIADYNFKQFGRVLCAKCGAAENKRMKEQTNAGQA